MANFEALKTAIQQVIRTNGNREITGALLQQTLLSMVNSLGEGYRIMGVADKTLSPGTPDQKVAYIVASPGHYNNFSGSDVKIGQIGIFYYHGVWGYLRGEIPVETVNISFAFPTSGIDGGPTYTKRGAIDTFGQWINSTSIHKGISIVYLDENNKLNKIVLNDPSLLSRLSSWLPEPVDIDTYMLMSKRTAYASGYISTAGKVVANNSYQHSDYIEIDPDVDYVTNCGHNIAFYDENKNFISYVATETFTTPANAKFARYSYNVDDVSQVYFYAVGGQSYFEGHSKQIVGDLLRMQFDVDWRDGYYTPEGVWVDSENYKTTTLFPVRPNYTYDVSNYFRFLVFDLEKNVIGVRSRVDGQITTTQDSAYAAMVVSADTDLDLVYIMGAENALSNVATVEDLNNQRKLIPSQYEKSLRIDPKNLSSIQNSGGSVVGTPGGIGAVYTIPLHSTGIYSLGFDFVLSKTMNRAAQTLTLAKFDKLIAGATTTNGGFIVDIVEALATSDGTQQANFNSGLIFYPQNTKNNNFKAQHFPANLGIDFKQFTGNDAFSLRFIGDKTVTANRDIAYTIGAQGLRIFHTANDTTIANFSYPADDKMETFVTTIQTACMTGSLAGLFEIEYFDIRGRKCSDLDYATSIPMISNYDTIGWDAFPCYLTYVDDGKHRIEVVFNNAEGESSDGLLMMFFLDGMYVPYVDMRIRLNGSGVFDANLILGCAGVQITDIWYAANSTKIREPKIIVHMAHDINDEISETVPAVTSISQIERIMEMHRAYGSVFVPISQIRDYIENGGSLPDMCYTIIHDDYYYLFDADENAASRKLKDLYMRNNAKASFAIINQSENAEAEAEAAGKDRKLFEFYLHGQTDIPTLGYTQLVSYLRTEMETFRGRYGDNNIYTYPQGLKTRNAMKVMSHLGFAYANIVGGAIRTGYYRTGVCDRYNNMSMPRFMSTADLSSSTFFTELEACLNFMSKI